MRLVQLDEGVRLPTNIIDCAPEDVRADAPVQAAFDDVALDLTLVKFCLAVAPSTAKVGTWCIVAG